MLFRSTDYLLAELELRSDGQILFPAGFITPKVGPHRAFGFRSGKVYGQDARLVMIPGFVVSDNPNVEIIMAETDKEILLMLMNDLPVPQTAGIAVKAAGNHVVKLAPYGLEIVRIPNEKR